MKSHWKTIFASILSLCLFTVLSSAQGTTPDSTGFPGDNFSLEGALGLFEEAKSLEDFEKELNTEKNHVNNLDLNDDGEIDYIRVIDNMDGDVHAIVLQAPLNATESQDIAVIEIEKTGKEEAMVQIIGDEDVYGEQKIVEPFEVQAKQKGKGPAAQFEMTRVIVNVWFWPSVRFIYGPRYRVYVSPWGWRVYPRYWRPWRPHPWRWHVSRVVYRPHFRVCRTHRVVRAHKVYVPHRRTTKVVRTKTTVVKNRNGKVVGAKTTKTTTVRGKNGKVKAKKSTTKAARKTPNGVKAGKKTTQVKKTKNGGVKGKKTTTKVRKNNKKGSVKGKRTTTKVKRKRN